MDDTPYDSTQDTLDHVHAVRGNIFNFSIAMARRAQCHDNSKFESPEKEAFDRLTPKLKASTYGSDEYKAFLADLGEALKHHYAHNSHHPEHWPNGIADMSLLDIVEMFCDWSAACRRHANGSLTKSIDINGERFDIPPKLVSIFHNTAKELKWLP